MTIIKFSIGISRKNLIVDEKIINLEKVIEMLRKEFDVTEIETQNIEIELKEDIVGVIYDEDYMKGVN